MRNAGYGRDPGALQAGVDPVPVTDVWPQAPLASLARWGIATRSSTLARVPCGIEEPRIASLPRLVSCASVPRPAAACGRFAIASSYVAFLGGMSTCLSRRIRWPDPSLWLARGAQTSSGNSSALRADSAAITSSSACSSHVLGARVVEDVWGGAFAGRGSCGVRAGPPCNRASGSGVRELHSCVGKCNASAVRVGTSPLSGGTSRWDMRSCSPPSLLGRHAAATGRSAWSDARAQSRSIFGSALGPSKSVTFSERRLVPYSPGHVFSVVACVEDYHLFVPWCRRSVILKRVGDSYMEAELDVGFQVFKERYVSLVSLEMPSAQRPGAVASTVRDSALFRHLKSTWRIAPGPTPGTTWLSVHVDFAFRSELYSHISQLFRDEVVRRMITAFESRCAALPDPSKRQPAAKAAPARTAHSGS